MDLSNVKCLVFDLDDTLVNSSMAYEKALASIGVDSRSACFQKARQDVKNSLGGRHVSARNRLLYFKKMLENMHQFSARRTLEMMKRYEDFLMQDIGRQWFELGRVDLFEELFAKFRLGIISNENTRTQLLKVSAMDPLGKYFKWTCFSEDVGVEKPELKIFDSFFKISGFKPNECCMIGDSLDCDIVPALQLGMKAIVTEEFHPQNSEHHFFCISKLDDIRKIL